MAQNFKEKSVFVMILLTIITLGIYIPVYLLYLKKSTDKTNVSKKISKSLIIIVLVMIISEIILIYPSTLDPNYDLLRNLISFIDSILILILAFQFRSVLNEHFKKKKNVVFSGVATFFFTIFYLQYKINKILEQ